MNENNQNDKFATQRFERVAANNHRGKKQKKLSKTIIYIVCVLASSVLLSIFFIDVANDALGLMKDEGPVQVTISKGDSVAKVAEQLEDAGIIEYTTFFRMFTKVTGNSGKFQYGIYNLNKDMDYLEICTALKKPATAREEVKVTIPEGYELREIFAKLEEKGVCKADKLYDYMNKTDFNYDFLKNLPDRENKLEGYLFPDTYNFFKDEEPSVVITKFLDNFQKKFDSELFERAGQLGYTMDEVVILASIIEREAANDDDRATVASVFVNRLNSKDYPLLQSCATVQYVLKERKAILSIADTKIDSKYNTYMYEGLPIGPIASPGLASIKAALYPEKTNYYFFVVDGDGIHHFSETLAQHNKAVAKASTSRGTGTVS